MSRLKESKTRANIVMLAITLCMFANSSTVWAVDLAGMVKVITTIQMIDPTSSPEGMPKKSSHPRSALYEVTELMLAMNVRSLHEPIRRKFDRKLHASPACSQRLCRRLLGMRVMAGKRHIKILFLGFPLINGLGEYSTRDYP